jgi:GH18 family chitinase
MVVIARALVVAVALLAGGRAFAAPVVFCYVETLYGGATIDSLDLRPCTHVVDAFVLVEPSGALTPARTLPRRALVAAAHARGAKALVSVGGATVPGATFAGIAAHDAARTRFLSELARFVAANGYDGVDLDWEFPTPAERALHVELTRALRARLGEEATIVVGLSPASRLLSYDFRGLAHAADFLIQFGYDFRNPALGPWANKAPFWPDGASAPIEGSVRGAASEMVRRGLPRDKLVIALPLYASDGRPWSEVRAGALAAPAPPHPLYLERQVGDAWVNDAASLEAKVRQVIGGSEIAGGAAAGVALWQLGHQGRYHDLTDAVRRALTMTQGRRSR